MLSQLSTIDAVRFVIAILAMAAGVVSLLVYAARIRRRDHALLFFGLSVCVYGARLMLDTAHPQWLESGVVLSGDPAITADLVLTLSLPVLLTVFMAQVIADEWKPLAWWIGLYGVVATWALIYRFLHPSSLFPWRLNNFVVLVSIPIWVTMVYRARRAPSRELQILRSGLIVFLLFVFYNNLFWFRALHRGANLEFIGFAILLCCLGYVALARARRNEERLFALNKELEIARDIQEKLLPGSMLNAGELTVASRYVPATSVAGDFYDFLANDNGLGVLIADVSGHGIPAALSASMVKVAVRAQMQNAEDPARVLCGMNSILHGNLQGQFVSAGYLYLNPARRTLTYAGAGHPPLLLWHSRSRKAETLLENGLPLGIFSDGAYHARQFPLAKGDRCVLYTDGLLEAPSPSGEEFGPERLMAFVADQASLVPQAFCDKLVARVSEWCGETQQAHDDLTIVVVDFA